ncbi:MAG: ATP-binding protein [Spirochaetales bacterium]|nr:ATP-binding protein [Spirochaetales bacterium]
MKKGTASESGKLYDNIFKDLNFSSTLVLGAVVVVLYLISLYMPDLGRSLILGWVILSAWTIMVFTGRTNHFYGSALLTMASYVFFSAVSLYIMYLVSYEQRFFFDQNMTVQFWLGASFVETLGMALILVLYLKRLPVSFAVPVCIILSLGTIALIASGYYPACISVDGDFTAFMKFSSITVAALYLTGLYYLFRSIRKSFQFSELLMSLTMLLSTLSTLVFVFGKGESVSVIAYILKALAYHSLYRGVFLEAVLKPIETLKKTESELRREEFFYRQTLTAVNEGMFRYYADRGILEVSSVWEVMTGHFRKDYESSLDYFNRQFAEKDRKEIIRSMRKAIKDGSILNGEYQVCRKNGDTMWILMRARMGSDQEGRPCLIGMMSDITHSKAIEKELIEAKEKAEESNRLKTSFLANISHEIRTPLNVILGFTGLLVKDLPEDENSEERQKFVELIRQSSNQLITIISNIIDISRIQNESIDLQVQKLPVRDFFQNLYTVYRKLMDDRVKKEIRLNWSYPDHMPDYIFLNTDIERFHQIWQNLLNNAMKFIEYGQISYGVHSFDPEEGKIVFFVEDTGPGISSGKDQIIFERFRQGEEGLARRYGGSGLGLSICRELLQQMKGDIYLDKEYSGGARFLFSLPEYGNDSN